jgi:hypothetical protein
MKMLAREYEWRVHHDENEAMEWGVEADVVGWEGTLLPVQWLRLLLLNWVLGPLLLNNELCWVAGLVRKKC